MPVLSWLDPNFVRQLVIVEEKSVAQVILQLQQLYPNQDGLSERNVKRFLSEHEIHKRQFFGEQELDEEVATASAEVGGMYGRKMMKGYLKSKGIEAADKRVGRSLQRVAPYYHGNRALGTQNQVNPQQYHAPHFGYNIHMDQNEKLAIYGIVFVIAVDGLSALIAGAAVMPRKNNITIYSQVYVKAVEMYGLWDCVNCDHGKEFFLVEFIQQYMSNHRIRADGTRSQREPYKQMPSTKNNRVERMWVEVNNRVGYPIKYALIDMEERQVIDSGNPTHLFAISQVSISVAQVGLQRCIDAWNNHSIPGSGIPSNYVPLRQNYQLPNGILPTVAQATQLYQASGGQLTEEYTVGNDPLSNQPQMQEQREQRFRLVMEASGGVGGIFSSVSNHNYTHFENAIQQFLVLFSQVAKHFVNTIHHEESVFSIPWS